MKKYRVHGNVNVVVTKEVWAESEQKAYEKAYDELSNLTAYCGNGGIDKLVGVDGYGESVDIFEDIDYDDIELLEEDPDYFECPDCEDQCVRETDADGVEYWRCDCGACWDDDGDEFYPEEDE